MPFLCVGSCNAVSPAADTCEALGVCAERAQPAETIDVLCDRSVGSTCTTEAIQRTVDAALEHATKRPGSRVRVWLMADAAALTAPIVERAIARAPSGSERSRRSHVARELAAAREVLLAAGRQALEGKQPRKSPIAESIAKIALADAGGLPRRLVVITDAREMSPIADFECRRLPSPAAFLATLRGNGLLTANQLDGFDVEFAFVESAPLLHRGCPVTVAREAQIRDLWLAAIRGAGAASARISSGPPRFSDEEGAEGTSEKEPSR
jgi:hypothetical protein